MAPRRCGGAPLALVALLALLALAARGAAATSTCSVTSSSGLDFSAAATPCADAANLCTTCLAAVTAPLSTAGACDRAHARTRAAAARGKRSGHWPLVDSASLRTSASAHATHAR
jgi:hypothetical protein